MTVRLDTCLLVNALGVMQIDYSHYQETFREASNIPYHGSHLLTLKTFYNLSWWLPFSSDD